MLYDVHYLIFHKTLAFLHYFPSHKIQDLLLANLFILQVFMTFKLTWLADLQVYKRLSFTSLCEQETCCLKQRPLSLFLSAFFIF